MFRFDTKLQDAGPPPPGATSLMHAMSGEGPDRTMYDDEDQDFHMSNRILSPPVIEDLESESASSGPLTD